MFSTLGSTRWWNTLYPYTFYDLEPSGGAVEFQALQFGAPSENTNLRNIQRARERGPRLEEILRSRVNASSYRVTSEIERR